MRTKRRRRRRKGSEEENGGKEGGGSDWSRCGWTVQQQQHHEPQSLMFGSKPFFFLAQKKLIKWQRDFPRARYPNRANADFFQHTEGLTAVPPVLCRGFLKRQLPKKQKHCLWALTGEKRRSVTGRRSASCHFSATRRRRHFEAGDVNNTSKMAAARFHVPALLLMS